MNEATSSAASPDLWTTRRLLDWMVRYLSARGVEDVRLTSELLLAHVLHCERLRLFMEVDGPAAPDELARLRELVKRVGRHEPLQYVLGEGGFYGRPFEVNRSTLIPRPCTETLVEQVIWHVRKKLRTASEIGGGEVRGTGGTPVPLLSPHILDLGTGTGCIAITLAKELALARLIATDISEEILALARRNAERHGVPDRIDFRTGSLFDPLDAARDRFDIICANPPYIPDSEWHDVKRNVKDYEPVAALRGGADGLDFIRPIIAKSIEFLNESGLLAVEIASVQRDEAIRLATAAGFASVRVIKDHEQKWRVLLAER